MPILLRILNMDFSLVVSIIYLISSLQASASSLETKPIRRTDLNDSASFTGFFLSDKGCTCRSAGMPGTLYSGALPHTSALPPNNSIPQNLAATNISLGVAGPPYVFYPPYAYLESNAMGIDRARQKVYVGLSYYDTADTDAIFSLNYDGTERTQVLVRDKSSVAGIAVASEKMKIYYSEGWDGGYAWANDTRIRRANLDGSGIETVLDMNKMDCRLANSSDSKCPPRAMMLDQVVLDDTENYMYWTALNYSGSAFLGIWRARSEIAAGQTWANRTDVEHLLTWASPAQFRIVDGYVYWVDTSRQATGNETYPFTSPVFKQSTSSVSKEDAELLFGVPLRKYESAQGLVFDASSGEIWVLLNGQTATLWRFDKNGHGTPRQIRDGMYVNQVTGFEAF